MFLYSCCQSKNRNWFSVVLLPLTGPFRHVVVGWLVGAKTFMRFLSGGISQHHLHLHSIHHPTVEQ